MYEQGSYADVNGTRLYYEELGAGHPIILIHGLGADARVWDAQVEPFAKQYRVIRYDTRGHGRSALPTAEPYRHADDLNALLDHLHIEQANVVGQSLGGEIAIDFALAHPERIDRLIVADPMLTGYPWSDEWNASWGPIASAAATTGPRSILPRVLEHPLLSTTLQQPQAKARLTEIFSDYSGWHFVNADPVRWSDPPAMQRLPEIQAPTLILLGERDLPDLHHISDILARDIKQSRKVVFPGVGHIPLMEVPDQFNEVVLRFLADG